MAGVVTDLMVTRAISLTQPWASLVAIGAKKHETRCWPTGYRGWLAIHASKGFPRDCQELCASTPFRQALRGAGYRNTKELPRGVVLAVVRLTDCLATAQWAPPIESDEYAFGNYEPIDSDNGKPRYSFNLEDLRQVRAFGCKGALGIWKLPQAITAADILEA